jgi:hypothetical protein
MIKEARIASVLSLFPLPQYVVILEDLEKTHMVPIWIGPSEGSAIAMEMQGEKFPRPLTHDLMATIIKGLNAQVDKIVVSDLKDASYYANILLRRGQEVISIDARPSDSLALAVRVHCPIFVDEKVLLKCPEINGPISKTDIEKFKKDLKTMTPEEFFKDLEKEPPQGPGLDDLSLGPDDEGSEPEGDEPEEPEL